METNNSEIINRLINIEETLARIEDTLNTEPKTRNNDIAKNKIAGGIFESETTFEKLANDTGLEVDELRSICEIENDDVRLLVNIEGRNETERQAKASICILTFSHYLLGKNEISSQVLTKKLQWLGIKSLANLSRTLKESRQYIIPNGKPGSQIFSYRLTYPGIKQGLEYIKELCNAK